MRFFTFIKNKVADIKADFKRKRIKMTTEFRVI